MGEAGGQVQPPEIAEGKGARGKRWEIFRRGRRKSREKAGLSAVSEEYSGWILRKLTSCGDGIKTALWMISERLRERQEAKEDWNMRGRRSLKRVSIGERKRKMAEYEEGTTNA